MSYQQKRHLVYMIIPVEDTECPYAICVWCHCSENFVQKSRAINSLSKLKIVDFCNLEGRVHFEEEEYKKIQGKK